MLQFLNVRTSKTLVLLASMLALAACQKNQPLQLSDISDKNVVTAGNPSVSTTIGEGANTYSILGSQALRDQVKSGTIALAHSSEAISILAPLAKTVMEPVKPKPEDKPSTPAKDEDKPSTPPTDQTKPAPTADDSLLVGYPIGLLDEHQVFGAIITAVSDQENQMLGMLKLTDLPPVHVHTAVVKVGEGEYAFALLGCANNCKEGSDESPLIAIPIVGVTKDKKNLLLDVAALGDQLNLLKMLDPNGSMTKLQTKSSRTVSFDYSLSTLVFDIETTMVPFETDWMKILGTILGGKPKPKPGPGSDVASLITVPQTPPKGETVFTVRWYLKLASAFNPAFEPRSQTDGVGFFLTSRSASPRIERVSRPAAVEGFSADSGTVHYFIKNVPEEYKTDFSSAFDEWNEKFTTLTGHKIFSYEFVDSDNPKSKLLITGDPRYNIVEWDLVNKAPYGGLGPSLANQYTGEIFSAAVLIQGPTIVQMYSKWFDTAKAVEKLRVAGNDVAADKLLHDTTVALNTESERISGHQFDVRLGNNLDFRIPSQLPSFEDPYFERIDFDQVPAGSDYKTYMYGYFHEMLAHELGHNLGLRHNFRGNLGAAIDPSTGGVSDSIMEYLGRTFRQTNRIGSYDLMAIKYGYLGTLPARRDLFCTDEDVPSASNPNGSAECSADDATTDPFGYFDGQLAKGVDLLVGRTSAAAPDWSVTDMNDELTTAIKGMTLYAATAENSASKWTNFFNGADRPNAAPDKVKGYVLAKLKSHLLIRLSQRFLPSRARTMPGPKRPPISRTSERRP